MHSINEIGPLQKRVLFSSFTGWMFDGFETCALILVASAAILSLDPNSDPDRVRLAVGSALGSTLMGWAVGGIIGSVMADRIGRKKMLIVSVSGYCAFTAFAALSTSVTITTAAGIVFNATRLAAFPLAILTAHMFSALGGFQPTVLSLTPFYVIGIVALTTLPETKGQPRPN